MRTRTISAVCFLIVVSATTLCRQVIADEAALSNRKLSAAERSENRIKAALREPKSWTEFSGTLDRFVEKLNKELDVPVKIQRRSLDDIGFDFSQRVSAPGTGTQKISGRNYLALVLRQLDLEWIVSHESILITTTEYASGVLTTRVHPVYDLVYLGTRNGKPQFDNDWLVELITTTAVPESWDQVGGSGSISVLRQSLVVSQTRDVHADVEAILEALRSLKTEPSGLILGQDDAAQEKALNQRVSLDFDDQTLSEVVQQLTSATDLIVTIDRRALEDIGFDSSQKITFDCENISLRSALRLMLNDVDLTYAWQNGTLQVTVEETKCGMIMTQLYPVGDLAKTSTRTELDFDSLIELVTTTLSPQSWDEVGGAGSIVAVERPACLAVSQTEEIHAQIADLLAMLRREEATIAKQRDAAAAKNLVAPEPPVTTQMYSFREDVEVADIAEGIEKFVRPESWGKDPQLAIQVIGKTIVIRQTAETHAEIDRFLQQVGVRAPVGGGIF